jgi:hypothetical protein
MRNHNISIYEGGIAEFTVKLVFLTVTLDMFLFENIKKIIKNMSLFLLFHETPFFFFTHGQSESGIPGMYYLSTENL